MDISEVIAFQASAFFWLALLSHLFVTNYGNKVPHGLNESHPLVSSEIVTALPFGISHGSRVSK